MSIARIVILLGVAPLAAGVVAAQTDETTRERTPVFRRWTVMLEVSYVRSQATGGMESAMRDNGYDDATPGGCLFGMCSEGMTYPYSTPPEPGTVAGLSVRYALTRGLHVRATLTPKTSMGTTTGFQAEAPQSILGDYVELRVRAGSVALTLAPIIEDVLWVEAGPALVWGEVSATPNEPAVSEVHPGLLLGAGLNVTPGRRLAVEFAVRYRSAAPLSISPFATAGTSVDVPLTYTTASANVGVRF